MNYHERNGEYRDENLYDFKSRLGVRSQYCVTDILFSTTRTGTRYAVEQAGRCNAGVQIMSLGIVND